MHRQLRAIACVILYLIHHSIALYACILDIAFQHDSVIYETAVIPCTDGLSYIPIMQTVVFVYILVVQNLIACRRGVCPVYAVICKRAVFCYRVSTDGKVACSSALYVYSQRCVKYNVRALEFRQCVYSHIRPAVNIRIHPTGHHEVLPICGCRIRTA